MEERKTRMSLCQFSSCSSCSSLIGGSSSAVRVITLTMDPISGQVVAYHSSSPIEPFSNLITIATVSGGTLVGGSLAVVALAVLLTEGYKPLGVGQVSSGPYPTSTPVAQTITYTLVRV